MDGAHGDGKSDYFFPLAPWPFDEPNQDEGDQGKSERHHENWRELSDPDFYGNEIGAKKESADDSKGNI